MAMHTAPLVGCITRCCVLTGYVITTLRSLNYIAASVKTRIVSILPPVPRGIPKTAPLNVYGYLLQCTRYLDMISLQTAVYTASNLFLLKLSLLRTASINEIYLPD